MIFIKTNWYIFIWTKLTGTGKDDWHSNDSLFFWSHVSDQIDNAVGITIFIIVPWDQFDKIIVELDTSTGVEGGGVVGTVEILK